MIRQLTKKTRDGHLYVHPPAIASALLVATGQTLPAVLQRAAIREPEDPQYLPSEVLLHLIRNALRAGDELAFNSLLPVLLNRCMAILCSKIQQTGLFDAAHLREDIMSHFSELIAKDAAPGGNERLDFYEVRFNGAFRTLRLNFMSDAKADGLRFDQYPDARDGDIAASGEPDIGDEIDEDVAERVEENFVELASSPDPEAQAELAELLRQVKELPPKLCKAVTLRIMGFAVESTHPEELTIASLCKVRGRTVRNWLSAAAERIPRLKEISK